MIIEDNADDEMLTKRGLKRSGFECIQMIARDGSEAVDILDTIDPTNPPVLVFLDLKMPKLNGLEVLAKIRAHKVTQNVPVVVLTSSDESGDIQSSYELGANSYIRKPVNFDEYLEAVVEAARYWLELNCTARYGCSTEVPAALR